MKVRDVFLAFDETIPDTKVWLKDIAVNLPIQFIYARYKANNGATSNTVGKLCHEVSKLEVVDGSDVLYSLSGRQVKALNFFENNHLPHHFYSQVGGGVIEDAFYMNFGRFLGDREYYLDPRKFTNPQIRLSSAFTVSATAGIATGSGRLTVILRVIDEGAPASKGFITNKEVYNWTTLASGDEHITLPRDRAYKSILLSALETLTEPQIDITNLKLSIDNDKWIPYNLPSVDILARNLQDYGWCEEICRLLPDTSRDWLSNIFKPGGAWACEAGATAKAIATVVTAERVTAAMTTGETGEVKILVRGYSPHSCFYLPFGDGIEVGDYFDPKGVAAMELIATQGGAGGEGKVVIQQLRS